MSLLFTTFKWFFKSRLKEIESLKKNPIDAQQALVEELVSTAKDTEWGKKYHYESIRTIAEFQKNIPISSYEDMSPYIERMMNGETDILWPGQIEWFSKSSGTTNARSKFIPVSQESLEGCHFGAGRDELVMYIQNNPETRLLSGKSLVIGGSYNQLRSKPDVFCGDISAVMMKNLPMLGEYLRTPSLETALMSDYEEKIEKLAEEAMKENVTSIAGVPTWTILLIKKILQKTGAKTIFEVWPNLEVFFHGAVAFEPYRQLFTEIFPSPQMRYMEAYNSSEGFFAIQDDPSRPGEMMLMPDYGVLYEFIPMSEYYSEHSKAITMADVELNKNYALIISTNAGLWRYSIGDTVSFTTLFPHRIKITGRTKHFINAFGEEVMVSNTDTAIQKACEATGAQMTDYTVAPIFMEQGKQGAHEWVIEFEKEPNSLDTFKTILDETLRTVNSDYDAKRYKDIAVGPPVVRVAPVGTFYEWMKSRNKLGGQNKVPRLCNTREYIDTVLQYTNSST
jgi:GH3 auxin-responsive promoter